MALEFFVYVAENVVSEANDLCFHLCAYARRLHQKRKKNRRRGRVNKKMYKQITEWMNRQINDLTKESTNDLTKEWTNVQMNKSTNQLTNKAQMMKYRPQSAMEAPLRMNKQTSSDRTQTINQSHNAGCTAARPKKTYGLADGPMHHYVNGALKTLQQQKTGWRVKEERIQSCC